MQKSRFFAIALPPVTVLIMSVALWSLNSRFQYAFDPSISSLSPLTLAFAAISLLLSAIIIIFSRRFLLVPESLPRVPIRMVSKGGLIRVRMPAAELFVPLLTENIIVLGFISAIFSKNAAIYVPFLALWAATFAYVAQVILSLPDSEEPA